MIIDSSKIFVTADNGVQYSRIKYKTGNIMWLDFQGSTVSGDAHIGLEEQYLQMKNKY